ncbi:SRPBCC domain-containing protein [Yinghuangia sp. YIM S09857]|uniref:SRPBCC domain-containing protein n=1 Tax=Yinghuangia sp. YIM S09857 TaxID=3436929 RepID=UPI003F530B8A
MSTSAHRRTPGPVLGPRHETFTLDRDFDESPASVFAAFGDPAIRRRWFALPGKMTAYHHVFGVGGTETARSVFTSLNAPAERLDYRARYVDIVPAQRIVHVYEARVDDVLRWASLVTVELHPRRPQGTQLRWTEQVAFITFSGDGSHDLPHLRGATGLRLNGLAAALKPANVSTP